MRSSLRSTGLTTLFSTLGGVLAVLAFGACAGCESATPNATYPLSARAPLTMALPSAVAPDAAGVEVRQVFAEWQQARATSDASALEALYDVRRFEGVRWTKSGIEKRMTWGEWSAEHPAGSHSPLQSARTTFESWPGGTLDAATASVTFDEMGPGAMHHVLVFGRGADGKLRIVREEVGGASPRIAGGADSLSRDAKVLHALAEHGDK
jgi:hypothetical protein